MLWLGNSNMKIYQFVLGPIATNTYLVADENSKKCFVVDPAWPSKELKAKISAEGLTPEYILLTHGHGDHTGGIDDLKAAYPEIKLVASRKERSFLYDRHASQGKGGIKADKEVLDGEELSVGDILMQFLSTPGHTPGGMCIYVKQAGLLFSGDTLFHTSVGRTDLPGGNFTELMSSIKEKLFVLPDDTNVLPGHDAPTTIGYEKRYNPFV